MKRVSIIIAAIAACAGLAPTARAGLIEVTFSGHIDSLVNWSGGLNVDDPIVFSYIIDLDDPRVINPNVPDTTAYNMTSIFFQAGNQSISRAGTQVGVVEISNPYPGGGDLFGIYNAVFDVPFMGVEPFGIEIILADDTAGVFSTSVHPSEMNISSFNYVSFVAGWRSGSIGRRDIIVAPDSIDIRIVPEPGTLALLFAGAATILRRRRRR